MNLEVEYKATIVGLHKVHNRQKRPPDESSPKTSCQGVDQYVHLLYFLMLDSHHPAYGSLYNSFAFDLVLFHINSYVEIVP